MTIGVVFKMDCYGSLTTKQMDVSITAYETCHRLRIADKDGIVSLNMTTEQLLQIADEIDRYLGVKK